MNNSPNSEYYSSKNSNNNSLSSISFYFDLDESDSIYSLLQNDYHITPVLK